MYGTSKTNIKITQKNGTLPEQYSSLLDKNENIEKIFALCNEFESEIPEYTDYMKYFYNIALTGECNYENKRLKFHIDPNSYGSRIDRIPVIIEFLQRDREKNPHFLHANQDEMESVDTQLKYIVDPELKEKFGALASYIRKNHTNSELLGRMQGILGYFIENKDADPNVFEFIGVSEEVARYLSKNLAKDTNRKNLESQKSAVALYKTYLEYSKIIKERCIKNEIIDEYDPVYKMLDNVSNNAKNGIVSDNETVKYRQMLAGVSLYCKQMEAKNLKITPNEYELNTILELSRKCYDENASSIIEYISECYSSKKTK